jgi:hypothetical protein
MHEVRVQRELIAYIRRHAPSEYATGRAELKREAAELMEGLPNFAARQRVGQIYHQRKCAMVIAMARYISMRP